MKNILILAIALFMGASLTSCEDDSVKPMAITPAGTFQDDPTDDELEDDETLEDDEMLEDE